MSGIGKHEVVVFPPSPWAKDVADLCRGTKISVGMQNMHFEQEGAFTGEVSPLMVKDAGCRYVLSAIPSGGMFSAKQTRK